MPWYVKLDANDDAHKLVARVMKKFHRELAQHEVTVGLLKAWPTENEKKQGEPALKLHGYGCAAIVKATPYKDRVLGLPDATITLDGQTWETLDDKQREALIDHELYHLYVPVGKDGPKFDDADRPKLKLRLHDYQLGGFLEIIERHGDLALEKQALDHTVERVKQLTFKFVA